MKKAVKAAVFFVLLSFILKGGLYVYIFINAVMPALDKCDISVAVGILKQFRQNCSGPFQCNIPAAIKLPIS